MGFPIRTSADHSFVAAPRSLSQLSTSFIATACQGIHRAPLSYFYLHGLHKSPQPARWQPRGPGFTSLSPSQVLLDYLSLIVTSLQLTTSTSKNSGRPARTARPASHHPGNPTPAPAPPDHSGRCIMVLHAITSLKNHLPDGAGTGVSTRRHLRGATGTPRQLSGQASRPAATCVELRGLEPRTPCLQSRCSSQLSYSPVLTVGLAGVEPATSRLSGVRSNHLSYKPIVSIGLTPAAGPFHIHSSKVISRSLASPKGR